MPDIDVNQVLENLDRRLSTVEQVLPTLATKDDLRVFATKDDLRAFATKDDLRTFATKDDLRAFATKDDLEAFATKDYVRVLFEDLRDDIRIVAEGVARLVERLEAKGVI